MTTYVREVSPSLCPLLRCRCVCMCMCVDIVETACFMTSFIFVTSFRFVRPSIKRQWTRTTVAMIHHRFLSEPITLPPASACFHTTSITWAFSSNNHFPKHTYEIYSDHKLRTILPHACFSLREHKPCLRHVLQYFKSLSWMHSEISQKEHTSSPITDRWEAGPGCSGINQFERGNRWSTWYSDERTVWSKHRL